MKGTLADILHCNYRAGQPAFIHAGSGDGLHSKDTLSRSRGATRGWRRMEISLLRRSRADWINIDRDSWGLIDPPIDDRQPTFGSPYHCSR